MTLSLSFDTSLPAKKTIVTFLFFFCAKICCMVPCHFFVLFVFLRVRYKKILYIVTRRKAVVTSIASTVDQVLHVSQSKKCYHAISKGKLLPHTQSVKQKTMFAKYIYCKNLLTRETRNGFLVAVLDVGKIFEINFSVC